jgi:3-phenylpropionate/cinnamic acid dioxygenase small subunit
VDGKEGSGMTDNVEAKAAITEVLLRYATAIDTKDWALFRTCFTADVDADYGEIGHWSDVDSITEFMAAVHEAMSDTKHMMHNMVIDVIDAGHATAVTYVHTVQALAADPKQWIDAVGQYRDEVVATPDGWRIARRCFTQTRMLSSFDHPAAQSH